MLAAQWMRHRSQTSRRVCDCATDARATSSARSDCSVPRFLSTNMCGERASAPYLTRCQRAGDDPLWHSAARLTVIGGAAHDAVQHVQCTYP